MSDLSRVPAFRGLSETGRAMVERRAVLHRFPGGKTIIEKGQEVSGAYFVLEGRLRVYSLLPGGKEATLYPLAPGETCVLALNSLFNDLLYPAWVQSELPTIVAVIPGPVYRTLFEAERGIRDLTVHTLSTLVFRLMAELDQVHSCTLEQRLAGFLLVRASSRGVVRLTQQELAAQLGTTREVVARLTSRMAARGLIATGRGQIALLRPTELSALAATVED
ncbi:MAG TPA: Crp/Fnr family transcriptional regulator [Magnetospirillum sp.]|nr:Crp/Fnr family transcriptional regulator [Magnetospirillum sp.]